MTFVVDMAKKARINAPKCHFQKHSGASIFFAMFYTNVILH